MNPLPPVRRTRISRASSWYAWRPSRALNVPSSRRLGSWYVAHPHRAPDVPRTAQASGGLEAEHREVGRHGSEGLVARVLVDALEELADLPGPAVEVRPEDWQLLGFGQLTRGHRLDPPPDPQLCAAGRPDVADPLGVPAGSDEEPLVVDGEEVDDRRAGDAGRTTRD